MWGRRTTLLWKEPWIKVTSFEYHNQHRENPFCARLGCVESLIIKAKENLTDKLTHQGNEANNSLIQTLEQHVAGGDEGTLILL